MRKLASPVDELEQLGARATAPLVKALSRIAWGTLRANGLEVEAGRADLARLVFQTMTLANLYGRRRLLLEADRAAARRGRGRTREFAAPPSPLVPPITYQEAVEDMIQRDPRLAYGYRAVQDLYSEEHAFALAKSADIRVTRRVQREIQERIANGSSLSDADAVIAAIGNWTKAYADTVYRTNLATAYSSGRFAQAADPDVAKVFGAFEFVTAEDVDVRPNHAAAHGLIAGSGDSIWERFSPPLGYNCRCALEFVDRWELEEKKLILPDGTVRRFLPRTFSRAYPDEGFGRGRPERRVWGS